jgi:hypothetical protein
MLYTEYEVLADIRFENPAFYAEADGHSIQAPVCGPAPFACTGCPQRPHSLAQIKGPSGA